jgi:hypothetical protein
MKVVAKRRLKLAESLKKGYATVYNQCLEAVKEKLETIDDWDKTQWDQSLHELINKIKRICVGFDDHKQELFDLVQALKMLFLYMQAEKDSVKEYSRNFKSFWDMVEAFGGSPGLHCGLVDGWLADLANRVTGPGNPSANEKASAKTKTAEAMKAVLLISGANKQ